MNADRRVIQCNVREATKIFPAGARAYVVLTNPGGGHDRIVIVGRSHGGRWVEKWERTDNLTDFRVKTLPPEHPFYDNERIHDMAPGLLASLQAACEREAEKRSLTTVAWEPDGLKARTRPMIGGPVDDQEAIAPAEIIDNPERAEELGLTVDARRMRRERGDPDAA